MTDETGCPSSVVDVHVTHVSKGTTPEHHTQRNVKCGFGVVKTGDRKVAAHDE